MQELLGRLTAVDPDARESLQVVAYFDALMSRDAGIDALLSGAAVLSGQVAGARVHGRMRRRDADGRGLPDEADPERYPHRSGGGWTAWIEREGPHRVVDLMILERLAVALELAESRRRPQGALDTALDDARPRAERLAALASLRVDTQNPVRLLATPVEDAAPPGPSAIMPSQFGILRATLTAACLGGTTTELPPRGGIGIWTDPAEAPSSWSSAVIAMRLSEPVEQPVVDAADLGCMLLLAESYDPRNPPRDVTKLLELDDRQLEVLQGLVTAESIRSAASSLGMHHSTVQARHEALSEQLGFDPRTVTGRMRYLAAALLARLTAPGRV